MEGRVTAAARARRGGCEHQGAARCRIGDVCLHPACGEDARHNLDSVIGNALDTPASKRVYVRRLFAKLGVSDRTTASIKAYALGLLVSADYELFVREARARQEAEGKPQV